MSTKTKERPKKAPVATPVEAPKKELVTDGQTIESIGFPKDEIEKMISAGMSEAYGKLIKDVSVKYPNVIMANVTHNIKWGFVVQTPGPDGKPNWNRTVEMTSQGHLDVLKAVEEAQKKQEALSNPTYR